MSLADEILKFASDAQSVYSKPTHAMRWPTTVGVLSQIAQVKAAGIASTPTLTSPSEVSPSTQGLPRNLTNVRVSKRSISATQAELTVSFDHPHDSSFTSAKIHLSTGTGNPVVIGEGSTSPIKVVLTKTSAASTIHVQATGNWGSVPVAKCPVQTVNLNDGGKLPTANLLQPTITGGGGVTVTTSGNNTTVTASGGDLRYLHTQSVASTQWVIPHQLGKIPSVSVLDGSGQEVVGEVVHSSVVLCTVFFASPQTGQAALN